MSIDDNRSISLRTYLYLGLGSIGLLFIVVTGIVGIYLSNTISEQSEAQIRILSRHRAQQAMLGALLKQEINLQAYLTNGEREELGSYREEFQTQDEAMRSILANMTPEDQAAAGKGIQALTDASHDWHTTAEAMIAAREKGIQRFSPQEMAAQDHQFDAIQTHIGAIEQLMAKRDDLRLGRLDDALANGRWIAFCTIVSVFVSCFLLARRTIQRVAEPLRTLSAQAREGVGFLEPIAAEGIQELSILSQALGDLAHRVQEREFVLREEREEAIAEQRYTTLLQQISREEEVLEAFEQALTRMLKPNTIRILLRTPDDEALECRVPSHTLPGITDASPTRCRILGDPMACRAIRQGNTVALTADDPTACICNLGVPEKGSYLCMVLMASGQNLGLVNLQSRDAGYWNPARIRRALSLVASTAAAIQLIRALGAAQERAIRDGLTGVYNRRFLDEILPRLQDQAQRKGQPLSALMLDIDHFKRFNDSYGHEAGDLVLKTFSHRIEKELRSGDLLVRYGGEEFAVLLTQTAFADALVMAERLRRSIEQLVMTGPLFPEGCAVTSSIGVATFPDHALDGEGLLASADKALYAAKGCGRNRVMGVENMGDALSESRSEPGNEEPTA